MGISVILPVTDVSAGDGRGGDHEAIHLEMSRVGEIDREHGEVRGQRHEAVAVAEVERIERGIAHVPVAHCDQEVVKRENDWDILLCPDNWHRRAI
jgi:hypothetical protein